MASPARLYAIPPPRAPGPCVILAGCLLGFACVPALADDAQARREQFFETRIRPVLVEACFRCHGGRETHQNLRVDSRAALLAGGDRGPAVVAGNPEQSLLIQALRRTHDEIRMPPDRELERRIVEDFVTWVDDGVVWPQYEPHRAGTGDPAFHVPLYWSFHPAEPCVPPVDAMGWSLQPIDAFIAAGHRERGLERVGPADRRTLLRRASFDLVGLPPTPGETEDFQRDDSPDSFHRLIDRLLASPRYGERWGRHWMDVARYADTAGDNADYPIPEMRRYRDYIIKAFNADLPYDQFVREQLAGDLLAREAPTDRQADQIVATGFLALSRRYGTAPYELWHLTLEDTIDTVGQAFLGLTLRCARCHDHKFDPITSTDYYALYGIFDSTRFPWAGGEEFHSKRLHRQHFVPLIPPGQVAAAEAAFAQHLTGLAGEVVRLETRLADPSAEDRPQAEQRLNELRSQQFNLQRSGLPPGVPGAYAVTDGEPRAAAVQERGDPGRPGPVVPRGTIAALCRTPLAIPPEASGRRQFADWLTMPDHPLTGRVMVNRLWQQHFGTGIVATPSNFGLRGAPPTHPELLDLIAQRFVEGGWSIKTLHRLILTSATWRLSSGPHERNEGIDPDNAYCWRHTRRRLDAEAIRDALLAVSGRLDGSRPGAHPFPPISGWQWTQHNQFKDVYECRHRSVYLMTQRLQRHPFLALFDGPDANTTTAVRTAATVPPQALYLMNSPEMSHVAESFADRVLAAPAGAGRQVELAWRLCYGRPPSGIEQGRAADYLLEYRRELSHSDDEAGERSAERAAWTSLARVLLSSAEFFYVD